jgi:hypothetical protein
VHCTSSGARRTSQYVQACSSGTYWETRAASCSAQTCSKHRSMLRWPWLMTMLLCAGDAHTVKDHRHGHLARFVRLPVALHTCHNLKHIRGARAEEVHGCDDAAKLRRAVFLRRAAMPWRRHNAPPGLALLHEEAHARRGGSLRKGQGAMWHSATSTPLHRRVPFAGE